MNKSQDKKKGAGFQIPNYVSLAIILALVSALTLTILTFSGVTVYPAFGSKITMSNSILECQNISFNLTIYNGKYYQQPYHLGYDIESFNGNCSITQNFYCIIYIGNVTITNYNITQKITITPEQINRYSGNIAIPGNYLLLGGVSNQGESAASQFYSSFSILPSNNVCLPPKNQSESNLPETNHTPNPNLLILIFIIIIIAIILIYRYIGKEINL